MPRTSSLLAAVAVVHVLAASPAGAATVASRFDGRWQNEEAKAGLRWLDLRIVERAKSVVFAWWTCDAPGGCVAVGPIKPGNVSQISVMYSGPTWKSVLWIGEAEDGVLMVREENSYADGGKNVMNHRLRRISDPRPVESGSDLQLGGGQRLVQGVNGTFQFESPGSVHEPPRVGQRPSDCDPRYECQARPVDVQALRPPFNPDDPSGAWFAQYNNLLWQVLVKLVRPDLLDAYVQSESNDPYDRFVKRSEFINWITQRQ